MKIELLKASRKLWNVQHVPRELNRINQRKWVQAVRMLGDKWVLLESQLVQRKGE